MRGRDRECNSACSNLVSRFLGYARDTLLPCQLGLMGRTSVTPSGLVFRIQRCECLSHGTNKQIDTPQRRRAFAAALELGGNTIRLLSVLIRPVNLKGDRNVMQYIRPVDWHGSISLLEEEEMT